MTQKINIFFKYFFLFFSSKMWFMALYKDLQKYILLRIYWIFFDWSVTQCYNMFWAVWAFSCSSRAYLLSLYHCSCHFTLNAKVETNLKKNFQCHRIIWVDLLQVVGHYITVLYAHCTCVILFWHTMRWRYGIVFSLPLNELYVEANLFKDCFAESPKLEYICPHYSDMILP